MRETKTIEGFQRPFSTLLLNSEELLVADFVVPSIVLINLNSFERRIIEIPAKINLLGPHCLTYSLDKKWIYITDYRAKQILRYSSDLHFDSIFLKHEENSWLLSGPATTRIDSFGCLYISDYGSHSIQKFSEDGIFLGWLGAAREERKPWSKEGSPEVSTKKGGFDRVHDIVFNDDQSFYVADTWNRRIQKFSADGRWISEISGFFSLPVSIDRYQNFLAISDVGAHTLQVFDLSGKHLKTLEGFQKPYDVRCSQTHVFVSDSDHQRIQIIPNSIVFQ